MTLRDWLGIAQAYFYLTLAGWLMFIRRTRLDQWIADRPGASNTASIPGDLLDREKRRAWWIEVAAARPVRWAMCLQRSLALCLWMQRRGYQPRIRIGIRRDNPNLAAHAWVEYGGVVINDDPNLTKIYASLRGRNS
jgi:hypothetical protein